MSKKVFVSGGQFFLHLPIWGLGNLAREYVIKQDEGWDWLVLHRFGRAFAICEIQNWQCNAACEKHKRCKERGRERKRLPVRALFPTLTLHHIFRGRGYKPIKSGLPTISSSYVEKGLTGTINPNLKWYT